jgi:hypothetical protein
VVVAGAAAGEPDGAAANEIKLVRGRGVVVEVVFTVDLLEDSYVA